jgi:hypothetical protein
MPIPMPPPASSGFFCLFVFGRYSFGSSLFLSKTISYLLILDPLQEVFVSYGSKRFSYLLLDPKGFRLLLDLKGFCIFCWSKRFSYLSSAPFFSMVVLLSRQRLSAFNTPFHVGEYEFGGVVFSYYLRQLDVKKSDL